MGGMIYETRFMRDPWTPRSDTKFYEKGRKMNTTEPDIASDLWMDAPDAVQRWE
jgi:hypothetical protein